MTGYKYPSKDWDKLNEQFKSYGWDTVIKKSSNISLCATTKNRTVINCYTNGTISTQGKNNQEDLDKLKTILNNDFATEDDKNKKVFIVHGHDENSLNELQVILYKFGLNPVVNKERASQGKTLIESLIDDMRECVFGIVLLTPDDYGYSKKQGEDGKQPRARQNVLLEMGMLIGLLGRNKIAVLRKGEIENPTDISGVIYKSYNTNVKEIEDLLRKEFKTAGLNINEE